MIVADANAVAALVLPGDESELTDQLQRADPAWVAPPLVLSELRSVMAKLVRTRRQTPAQACELLNLAVQALEAVTFEPDARLVFELVATSGCSSYDCEYVAIAEELGCPLATFDREVLRAFPSIAVHPRALVTR
ncbi:MAG: type II toxin-antitoxin system VapC family toxin, partial [Gemmatimonadaceae bacterium]